MSRARPPILFSLLSVFTLFFFLFACNRTVKDPGSSPPSQSLRSAHSIHSPIAIIPFDHQISEPILPVASFLRETLIQLNFNIVSDPQEAAFVLTGTIDRFDKTPLSLSPSGKAVEYRAAIGVSLLFSATGKNKPLLKWDDTAYADWEVSSHPDSDRVAQDRAIREASWNLSQKAASRLREFFAEKRGG